MGLTRSFPKNRCSRCSARPDEILTKSPIMTAKRFAKTEPQPIRRLLRRKDSREYFQEGKWTSNPSQATTFEDVVEVAEVCARYGLTDVEVALRFDQAAEDLFSTSIR